MTCCVVVDQVDLNTLCSAFDRQDVPTSHDAVIDVDNLWGLLLEVFTINRKTTSVSPDSEHLAELVLNWLLNLYDM